LCYLGIGIFILQTGVEVSCDRAWQWSTGSLLAFASWPVAVHWLASLGFVLVLRLLLHVFNMPLLPPFYFIAIPPAFYAILWLLDIPEQLARDHAWFFPAADNVDPFLIWDLIDFSKVQWRVIGDCVPTIIALCIFR
jgi:sulfate permease, SulP family